MLKLKKKTNIAPDSEQNGKRRKGAVAICLALLVVFAASFVVSFATYRSMAKVELGTAGVAVWAISAGAETGDNLSIDCNTSNSTTSYEFWVKNNSGGKVAEVAVMYSVEVVFSEALPNGVTIQLSGVNGTTEDGQTYTFTSPDWKFAAGVESTANHALTFTADPTVVESNFTASSIKVTVVAEQID